mmetsp:Transcript_2346/g.6968  ORF Transcript_2346/g.6968 Transcript_2346/m.6968 type:complete len:971 (-) Transcript_2346:983-3895(-)
MMAQLGKLKTSSKEANAAEEAAALLAASLVEDIAEAPRAKYVPQQDELPLQMAEIRARGEMPLVPMAPKPYAVSRPEALQLRRMELPACAMEAEIVAAVQAHDIVVICGATGSGKSTQLPQFLYEAGFGEQGLIGVTQPRRVATVATAQRVRFELTGSDAAPAQARRKRRASGEAAAVEAEGSLVAYATRYAADGGGTSTKVLFETDGVLLQEARHDLLLRRYSVIILDEAHERSLNTDFLLGMLSRAVPLRRRAFEEAGGTGAMRPLKLVIMSATLASQSSFLEIFDPAPPVVNISARQFPVTIHFARETALGESYFEEALKKTRLIDKKLPAGAILVFLTGKSEIDKFCDELNAGPRPKEGHDDFDDSSDDEEVAGEGVGGRDNGGGNNAKLHVVALYASMALVDQQRAIALSATGMTADGARVVVVSTNVAETSLTIPGVRYVVDAGRTKRRVQRNSGAVAFEVGWVSKASADQRAGRAGRTAPGHVYRLYSAAVYADTLADHEAAEIDAVPLEDVVLHAKALGVNNVAAFPFPTQPDPAKVRKAAKALARLGALDGTGDAARLSKRGARMAQLPTGARFAAMLDACAREDVDACTAVALVASMSEMSPFQGQPFFKHPLGDAHARLIALGAFSKAGSVGDANARKQKQIDLCTKCGLNAIVLDRVAKLFKVLAKAATRSALWKDEASDADAGASKKAPSLSALTPPSAKMDATLARCVAAGLLDKVARRAEPAAVEAAGRAIDPQAVLSRYERECAYECMGAGDLAQRLAYLAPSSTLYARDSRELPEWVVYSELVQKRTDYGAAADHEPAMLFKALRLDGATVLNGAWLVQLCPAFVHLQPPLDQPAPTFDAVEDCVVAFRRATFNAGAATWDLPLVRAALRDESADAAFCWLVAKGAVIADALGHAPPTKMPSLAEFHAKSGSARAAKLRDCLAGTRSATTLGQALGDDASLLARLRTCLRRFN